MTYNMFGGTLNLTQLQPDSRKNMSMVDKSPTTLAIQWRHQRSKGARSFWGQKILKPGHPESGA